MYIKHFCSYGLHIRVWIFLPVQLVRISVVILLRYVAGLRISCSIFAGPLVGTPDVVSLCIVYKYMLPALCRPAVCKSDLVLSELPHGPGICVIVVSVLNLCAMCAVFF